jgi:hypothetical protein
MALTTIWLRASNPEVFVRPVPAREADEVGHEER